MSSLWEKFKNLTKPDDYDDEYDEAAEENRGEPEEEEPVRTRPSRRRPSASSTMTRARIIARP